MTDTTYDQDACPGPCNRGYRKAVDAYPGALRAHAFLVDQYNHALAAYEDTYAWWAQHTAAGVLVLVEPVPPAPPGAPPADPAEQKTRGNPVWCSRDAGAVRRALASLDDLASLLESWADGHRGATSGSKLGATKSGSRSPSAITDTLDTLYGLLVTAEDQWRDHRGYPDRPQRARDSRARRLTIAFLMSELRDILENPGSVRFGCGVLAWERRLQAMTTSEPLVQRRAAVPCPAKGCGRRALRSRPDGYTQCAACGRLLSEEEYQELVDQMDIVVTVLEEEARAS